MKRVFKYRFSRRTLYLSAFYILVLALIGYLFKKVFRLTGFGIIDRLGGLALSVVKIGMLLAVLTGFYVIFGGYMATAINGSMDILPRN